MTRKRIAKSRVPFRLVRKRRRYGPVKALQLGDMSPCRIDGRTALWILLELAEEMLCEEWRKERTSRPRRSERERSAYGMRVKVGIFGWKEAQP